MSLVQQALAALGERAAKGIEQANVQTAAASANSAAQLAATGGAISETALVPAVNGGGASALAASPTSVVPNLSASALNGGGTMQRLHTFESTDGRFDSAQILAGEGYSYSEGRYEPVFETAVQKRLYYEGLQYVVRRFEQVQRQGGLRRFLNETMMTPDFNFFLGLTMDRMMLSQFETWPRSFPLFMQRRDVPDFREVGTGILRGAGILPRIAENETYKEGALAELAAYFRVSKYGRIYSVSFETLMNDDVGAFTQLPATMGIEAAQTEMYQMTSLYANNTALYSTSQTAPGVTGVTYANRADLPLTAINLRTAYDSMMAFPGANGMPLMTMPRYLVVPPGLQMRAEEIINSPTLIASGGDSTTGVAPVYRPAMNGLAGRLQVVVDPYLPLLDTTHGRQSWYLFADPAVVPVVQYGYIRGLDQPQLYQHTGDSIQLGGPAVSGTSFESDNYRWKTRHILGGVQLAVTGNWQGTFMGRVAN